MELTIKKEFKDLIPRLSNEEYELLTKSILSDGCRESILLWNGVIVDGHNRYEICTTNNVEFNTSDIDFTDDDAAKIWIIDNQMGRRNINEWVKFELSLKKKDILLKQGREKQKETLGGFKYESSVLSIIDTTDEKETHSTRKIIAEEIGKSTITGVVKKIIRLFNDNRITPDEAREVVARIGEIIRVSETE